MLEGEIGDDVHKMKAGDLQMMTAGGGIIHTETIDKKARMRLLQLWLNLPKKDGGSHRVFRIFLPTMFRKRLREGVELKLYSGSLAGISSPVKNHVPVIIADIQMQPDTSYSLNLAASYSTFLYVLDGGLQIGEEKKSLQQNQVGWLDRSTIDGDSELNLSAGKSGARFVLYAGQPQGDPIVSHGPFYRGYSGRHFPIVS